MMKKVCGLIFGPFLFVASNVMAGDTISLVVGGGYSPYGSQYALEQNMRLFASLADQFHISPESITCLFGAGNDVEILDILEEEEGFSDSDKLFAYLFNCVNSPECFLRHNTLSNLEDSATSENVLDWLDMLTRKISPEESFRFYYTGHGSHEDDDYNHNYLALWRGTKLPVQKFVEKLDQLPMENQSQVVMVQCFSGGFAQMNYVGGDPKSGISEANRCGFFSQVATRIASGCSADITFREEYSPYFFAAYLGHDEKGVEVHADFNKDGKITSDEAHAYVIIHENSFDNPITTSSQLLRDQGFVVPTHLLRESLAFFESRMNGVEMAIFEGLTEKIRYDVRRQHHPFRYVDNQIERHTEYYNAAVEKQNSAQELLDLTYEVVKKDLAERFAIFANAYGANHGADYVVKAEVLQQAKKAMLAHLEYENFLNAFLKRNEAREAAERWERLITKWERLKYLMETMLLEAVLEGSDKADVKKKYSQLRACESTSFFPYE